MNALVEASIHVATLKVWFGRFFERHMVSSSYRHVGTCFLPTEGGGQIEAKLFSNTAASFSLRLVVFPINVSLFAV